MKESLHSNYEYERSPDAKDFIGLDEEQSTEMTDQSATAETGLVLVEQDKTFEKSDIDALQQKAGELRGIDEVQRGLEKSIVGAGLQVVVDRYGADRFLEAMQSRDKDGQRAGTFREVIQRLAPEKGEQEALYEAVKTEPMDALAERLDQTLGGVAETTDHVSHMERKRSVDVSTIQGPTGVKERVIDRIPGKYHRPDNGGHLTDTHGLFSADFDNLLNNHPDLVENFRETNDTLGLLKGVRDIYETEYAQFSANLEQAKAAVEEKIASGEAGVAELQTLSDDIYGEEIAKLEERLAGASSDAAKEMVQGMLDKKAAEVTAARQEFKSKMEAVRSKIVADLGADRLYQLPVAAPAEVRPTYNDKEKYAA